VIVYHVAIRTSADYPVRREPHRHAHIERLDRLRDAGIVIAGGPAPDGTSADLFYRVRQARDLEAIITEDPYWRAGAWTEYTPRTFTGFVEPWHAVPIVLDGSRCATIVEGAATDQDMAQLALVEMRGAGRLILGGFLDNGMTLGIVSTADVTEAAQWLTETGVWKSESLRTRPFLYVI
jgi:uncharacterized protein YciI